MIVALVLASAPGQANAFRKAVVDGTYADETSGDVFIDYRDGRTVTAPKARDQRTLTDPAMATDGRTVGWLGNYDTCCQSYPVPRQLVIWRSGQVIRRIDATAMIWRWRFYKNGTKVGFADGPTHGSDTPYNYRLYDVATGHLIREVPGNSNPAPEWAISLLPPAASGPKE